MHRTPDRIIADSIAQARSIQSQQKSVWTDDRYWKNLGYMQFGNYGFIPASIYEYLTEGYQHWNYVCIKLIMNHVSRIPFKLCKGTGKTKVTIEANPAINLFEAPNPFMFGMEFMQRIIQHYCLSGNAFWFMRKNLKGTIGELWIRRPDLMTVRLEQDALSETYGYKIGYEYATASGKVQYTNEEIVHILEPSPTLDWIGMSIQQAMGHTFKLDADMTQTESSFMNNRGRPDVHIGLEGRADDTALTNMKQKYMEEFGGPEGAGRPFFTSGGRTRITPLNWSNADFQFDKLSGWVKEKIFTGWMIPLSIFDPKANRSNAREADVILNRECIVPFLDKLKEGRDKVAKAFDPSYYFEYDNPVPGDRDYDLEYYANGTNNGWLAPDEIRGMEGLDPWGDEYERPRQGAPQATLLPVRGLIPGAVPKAKDAGTEALQRRDRIWYSYIAKTNKAEPQIREAINRAFDADRKEIKRRLKAAMKAIAKETPGTFATKVSKRDIFPPKAEWKQAWMDALRKSSEDVFAQFGQDGMDSLTGSKAAKSYTIKAGGLNFDITNPYIAGQFDKLLEHGIAEINDTTAEKLWNKLADGIEAGMSESELAGIIDDTVDEWKTGNSRAHMIARTETTKLSNGGLMEGFAETGRELDADVEKEWISTRDDRTRGNKDSDEFNHLAADGETVPLNEPFQNTGEPIDYPGAPGASVGNVVECRCTMAANLKEKKNV